MYEWADENIDSVEERKEWFARIDHYTIEKITKIEVEERMIKRDENRINMEIIRCLFEGRVKSKSLELEDENVELLNTVDSQCIPVEQNMQSSSEGMNRNFGRLMKTRRIEHTAQIIDNTKSIRNDIESKNSNDHYDENDRPIPKKDPEKLIDVAHKYRSDYESHKWIDHYEKKDRPIPKKDRAKLFQAALKVRCDHKSREWIDHYEKMDRPSPKKDPEKLYDTYYGSKVIFYIALIFIGYILCDAAVVALSIAVIVSGNSESEILSWLGIAIAVAYSYLLPLVFFSTVERLADTYLVKKYESMRPWRYVIVSHMGMFAFIGCSNMFFNDDFGDLIRSYMIIACEICIYIVVTFLLLINQRRTRLRENDYNKLSCRYQLAENIRACRFLLTLVLFDSLLTATDLVADVGFNFSIVFELAIPCALATVGHESYRNRLKILLCPQMRRSVNATRRITIRSVLGDP
ncbi:hypothetical protein PRIPAC_96680, partial [Pristionchus pacificus]|uniref:G protein-coupled receptor n=1 Tax=Pristionchus pacificus TaxID=54126 RepID=A0A2A6D1T6_PRIPA